MIGKTILIGLPQYKLKQSPYVMRVRLWYVNHSPTKSIGAKKESPFKVYSEMNLKRVAQDFPTLVQNYPKKVKSVDGDTLLGDTISLPMTYI